MIEIENEQMFYDAYSFIFKTNFRLQKKSMLLSALMAGEPWGWRVIGITTGALNALARHEFRYTKGLLCRAHFVDRITTAEKLFEKLIPREQFLRRYFQTDETVIALKSENVSGGPSEYIPMNPERKLFLSRQVGFTHGKNEIIHLRDLYEEFHAGKVTLVRRSAGCSQPCLNEGTNDIE